MDEAQLGQSSTSIASNGSRASGTPLAPSDAPAQDGTFRRILRAATKVIADRGYHDGSIADVAAEAGVAEGTIYNHFDSKKDLLIRVFEEGIGRYVGNVRERLADADGPQSQVRALVAAHLDYLGEHQEVALITQVALRQPDRKLQRTLSDFLRPYFEVIDGLVAAGQEEGVFSAEVERLAARRLIFGTLDQAVTAWVLSEFSYDLRSMKEPLVRLLLAALMHAEGAGTEGHAGAPQP